MEPAQLQGTALSSAGHGSTAMPGDVSSPSFPGHPPPAALPKVKAATRCRPALPRPLAGQCHRVTELFPTSLGISSDVPHVPSRQNPNYI